MWRGRRILIIFMKNVLAISHSTFNDRPDLT